MQTWLIRKSDVEKVLNMESCIDSVEKAFRLYGLKRIQMPYRSYLTFENYSGDLRSQSAYIPDIPIAGIKAVNVHPENQLKQLPTVMATIILIDPRTGFPLAVMDGTYITNLRTGAAGAVAARYLARKNIKTIGFVGAGGQARALLDALMAAFPQIETAHIYDINIGQSEDFQNYCCRTYTRLEAIIEPDLAGAVAACDIVNTTTSSRKPLFSSAVVSPGTHINAIGADAEGKQELPVSLLKMAYLVIDDWAEASRTGEINVPYHMGELSRAEIAAELGEIVTGQKKGRRSEDSITIFDSAGLALQDIVAAWDVYASLMQNQQYTEKLLKINLGE